MVLRNAWGRDGGGGGGAAATDELLLVADKCGHWKLGMFTFDVAITSKTQRVQERLTPPI